MHGAERTLNEEASLTAIIISDKGRGLLLDCGLFPESALQRLVDDMKEHLGLKQIDAF